MKNFILLFAAVLFSAAVSMNAQSITPPKSLKVEVLVFSGRPNPTFEITDPAEIKEITALLNALPRNAAAQENAGETPVLGYRGIAVENTSSASAELRSFLVRRSNVQVSRGILTKSADGQARVAGAELEVRNDGSSSLEKRLLGIAQSRGAITADLAKNLAAAQ